MIRRPKLCHAMNWYEVSQVFFGTFFILHGHIQVHFLPKNNNNLLNYGGLMSKMPGVGFQFIWSFSENGIMNRVFASLAPRPPPKLEGDKRQNDGDKKARDRQKVVTKTKRITRPFASVKTGKKWQLMSRLIRKVL